MFFKVAALVFCIDRIIKYFIAHRLLPSKSIPIIKYILHLTYIKNYGAAFGLFSGQSAFLITIGIIISVLVIFYYLAMRRKEPVYMLSLGLILGGSLGNLYDRIFLGDRLFHGYVVDYIDIRIFPVFNFADIMINLGVLLILLKIFIFDNSK